MSRDARFQGSLVRTVLVVLLLLSLFPVLLIGTLNFFRARSLLRGQVSTQIKNIVSHEVTLMDDFVKKHDVVIDSLVTDKAFTDQVYNLVYAAPGSDEAKEATTKILDSFQNDKTVQENYDRIFLFTPDGSLLLTSDEGWANIAFQSGKVTSAELLSLSGSNSTVLLLNRVIGYPSSLVLVSARSFQDADNQSIATLIALSKSDTPYTILSDGQSFLAGDANSYFFELDGKLSGLHVNDRIIGLPANPGVAAYLKQFAGEEPSSISFTARSFNKAQVIGFAEWLPQYKIGVLLTLTEQSVYQANNPADPFNIGLLLITLGISGVLIFYGSTRLVNPLVNLAQVAERFSRGSWSERVEINRHDELGLLAFSFNRMADELSEMYHSLEAVVERRTSQLRIASEVAQLSTLTTRYGETLTRTTALIAERFEFYNVSIFLVEENGRVLALHEASGTAATEMLEQGRRIERNDASLPGWVANHNQARIITDGQDPLFYTDRLLPYTLSQMAVPIVGGIDVMGVLMLHSNQADVFEDESLSVFQTLANQISGSLQNTRLLQSAEVSYLETNLLYQATRQVTQARNEAIILQSVIEVLAQTPYVSALFTVEGETIKALAVTDPQTGRIEKNPQGLSIALKQMGSKLTENRVIVIEDIGRPSEYEDLLAFMLRRGVKNAALLAVVETGRLSKIITLGAREAGKITEVSLQPYTNLVGATGSALEKIHIVSTLQQRLSELQILANFAQAVTAETDLNALYHVLHQQMIQTLGPDIQFAIANYNAATNVISFPYMFERSELISVAPYTLGQGLTSTLIESRKPLLLPNEAAILERSVKLVGQPARSWMGVPLIFGGEVLGAIIIQDVDNENRFTQDDLNLLSTLAPQISTALRNTQLYTAAQEALHAYDQERFLLNTLLDAMPENITFKDPQGKFIRVSSSVAKIYNLQPDELIGKSNFDLLPHDSAEEISLLEQELMMTNTPQIGVITPLTLEPGKTTWVNTSRIPIHTSDGNLYGLLVIQSDVTGLKEAEALAQRRANQVRTAAEIARDTTGTLDVKTLLQKSVNLVRERFGFYHASIFLVDGLNEYAVLRESTGLAGEKMLQAGHRLAVGSKSIVGTVTATGEALIVNNVTGDPTHLPNPLLPETRSELAIPLKISDRPLGDRALGARILGALDVQSTLVNAFSDEDVNILQILADQMAVAVVNGELFSRTQELLTKHRLLRQITIAAGAASSLEETLVNIVSGLRTAMVGERIAIMMKNNEDLLQVQASAGYSGTRHTEMRIALGQGITGLAAQERRPIRVNDTLNDPRYINIDPDVRSELAIPILFGDELLGVLNLESTLVMAFDENDEEIMGALGNNLGGTIANVRLVSQVRRQVVRERQLFDVTSKIRHSVDLETILETSAKEIARVVGARRARIEITAGTSRQVRPDGRPGNGNGNFGQEEPEKGEN